MFRQDLITNSVFKNGTIDLATARNIIISLSEWYSIPTSPDLTIVYRKKMDLICVLLLAFVPPVAFAFRHTRKLLRQKSLFCTSYEIDVWLVLWQLTVMDSFQARKAMYGNGTALPTHWFAQCEKHWKREPAVANQFD